MLKPSFIILIIVFVILITLAIIVFILLLLQNIYSSNLQQQKTLFNKSTSTTKFLEKENSQHLFTESHIHQFISDGNELYWRYSNEEEEKENNEWKKLFFPKKNKNSLIKKIDADGANLVVIDSEHFIYYMKTILDMRFYNQMTSPYKVLKDKLQDDSYFWFPSIYFPIQPFCMFFPRHKIKNIKLDTLCVSHRSFWNGYLTTKKGEIFTEGSVPNSGSTTIFYWDTKFQKIRAIDPWLAFPYFGSLDFPSNELSWDTNSILMTSSGSMLIICIKDEIVHHYHIYKRMFDPEILGIVPHLIKYKKIDSIWEKVYTTSKTPFNIKLYNLGKNQRSLKIIFVDEKCMKISV